MTLAALYSTASPVNRRCIQGSTLGVFLLLYKPILLCCPLLQLTFKLAKPSRSIILTGMFRAQANQFDEVVGKLHSRVAVMGLSTW